MCGRYVSKAEIADLVEEFEVEVPTPEPLPADYNVAPTKSVYVVVDRSIDDELKRALAVARWGLVPSWAKDVSIGSRMINARAETVAEKPAFRKAFAKRRCLVPADGFYEWYLPTAPDAPRGKSGKTLKQPFFIHPADGSSMAMAGLYEWWRDEARAADDPDAWLLTCTIITTEATDDVGRVHDRMPMTIDRDNWSQWLDPTLGSDVAAGLLVPASDHRLDMVPVSTLVNSVRNNGPELIEPIAAEGAATNGLF